jgi:hypothetical protein
MTQSEKNSHTLNLHPLVLSPFIQPLLPLHSSSTWDQRNGATRADAVHPSPRTLARLNHVHRLHTTTNLPPGPRSLRSMRLHFPPFQYPSLIVINPILIVINPRIPHHTLGQNGSLHPSIHPFRIPIPTSIRLSRLEVLAMHPPRILSTPPADRNMAILHPVSRRMRHGSVTPMSNHSLMHTANWG